MADGEDFGLRDALGSRLRSAFFGGFVLSWLVLHWRLMYVTLFISGEQLGTVKGAEHIGSKLDYVIDHLHHHCGWTHWFAPVGVAMLTPWFTHMVDKAIQYVKAMISERWAGIEQYRDPKSFVTYEQFAHLVRRIKVLEGELRDAQVDAVNAQTAEAKAKNELAEVTKAKTDLEALQKGLEQDALAHRKYLQELPQIVTDLKNVETDMTSPVALQLPIKIRDEVEKTRKKLQELGTIHVQSHTARM